jgi:phosphoglycolate phosphatase-like HAD superfamily hydrolase
MEFGAVLWDFDDTIINTISKHFLINKEMFLIVKPNEKLPKALFSLKNYRKAEKMALNWRDLYKNHFGFNEEQIDYAGSLWGELVLKKSEFAVSAFEGVFDVIKKIGYPQGICSQNCSNNIRKILKRNGMDHHFKVIVGHLDIPINKQKPDPAGLILCIEKMGIGSGKIFYIGDHESDVKFVNNAKKEIKDFEIYSILASYSGSDPKSWDVKPDFEAKRPLDILSILRNLSFKF